MVVTTSSLSGLRPRWRRGSVHTAISTISVRCDSLTFGRAELDDILRRLEPVDAEATAALSFASSLGIPAELVTEDFEWMIGDDTPERLVVLGAPAAPHLDPDAVRDRHRATRVAATSERSLSGIGGIGYCYMELEADGCRGLSWLSTRTVGRPLMPRRLNSWPRSAPAPVAHCRPGMRLSLALSRPTLPCPSS